MKTTRQKFTDIMVFLAFTTVLILVLVGALAQGESKVDGGHAPAQTVTTSTTTDPYPNCGPACHDPAAGHAVDVAADRAGQDFVCWAEDSAQMPEGWEVICQRIQGR